MAWAGAMMLIATPAMTPALSSAGQRPAQAQAETTMPAGNVEHGRYLAERVAMCIECHSTRDEAGTIIPGEEFMGGQIPFRPPWQNTWASRAPRNRGLPGYTDEAAMRLLMHGGIDRNGVQLDPPMPRFHMSAQDAADVIAYLRSLP